MTTTTIIVDIQTKAVEEGILKRDIQMDDNSEGGYIKEETYIEEEEEDMYDVSDREREAPRIPRRNQDPEGPMDPKDDCQEDPGMYKSATHLKEQTLVS